MLWRFQLSPFSYVPNCAAKLFSLTQAFLESFSPVHTNANANANVDNKKYRQRFLKSPFSLIHELERFQNDALIFTHPH